MNHLPFIIAAYTVALVVPMVFGLEARWRLARARARLAALETRRRR